MEWVHIHLPEVPQGLLLMEGKHQRTEQSTRSKGFFADTMTLQEIQGRPEAGFQNFTKYNTAAQ